MEAFMISQRTYWNKKKSNKPKDEQRKNDLLDLKEKGELDDNLKDELDWHLGKRKRTKDYTYHRKANKLIAELSEDYTCAEIAETIGHTSKTTIQRLLAGDFDQVSEDYANKIYYWIKSAIKQEML